MSKASLFGWTAGALVVTGMAGVFALGGLISAVASGAGFGILPQGFVFLAPTIAGFVAWRGMGRE